MIKWALKLKKGRLGYEKFIYFYNLYCQNGYKRLFYPLLRV